MKQFIVLFAASFVLFSHTQSIGDVVVTHGTEYPTDDFIFRQKVPGGYQLKAIIDDAKVVFPSEGWKRILSTLPGAGYVIDPTTGACLRFDGISFGRRVRSFAMWLWTTSEHGWAERFSDSKTTPENQANFLGEWIRRSLINGDMDHPDNLSIGYPLLSSEKPTAFMIPLRLEPKNQPIVIQQIRIGAHNFTTADISTSFEVNGRRSALETSIWISYFRYLPQYEDHRFFLAASHIPAGLAAQKKREIRDLFQATLRSLSLNLD
jgi:hypothetical protein